MQPRVGDANFAALLESTIGERFRLVSNSEPVPHVPPTRDEAYAPAFVANIYLEGAKQVLQLNYPNWKIDYVDKFLLAVGTFGEDKLSKYLRSNRLYDALPLVHNLTAFFRQKDTDILEITLPKLMERILGGYEAFTHHGHSGGQAGLWWTS